MNTIDKIKAEIKRLKIDVWDEASQFDIGARCSLNYLDKFIATLDEQPSEDLEEELKRWRHDHFNGERDGRFSGEYLTRESQLDIARHFAQWGAEHLRDTTKKVEGLEECHEEQIIERAKDLYPKLLPFATYICGYAFHDNDGTPKETIQKYLAFGAEWQKEQMMKEAVVEVVQDASEDIEPWLVVSVDKFDVKQFDKVNVLIVKED